MKLQKIKKGEDAFARKTPLPQYVWKQTIDSRADVGELIVNDALRSDCTVCSITSIAETGHHELAVTVPAETGRPLLLLPAGYTSSGGPARNVLIAWKNTVHTIRAIDQAMPLLQSADRVTLLEINEDGAPTNVPAQHIAHLLSLHGIDVKIKSIDAGSSLPQELLAQELDKQGFDFLVMGAYSRARTREIIFGGFTEYVLDNMKVPTLLAH